MRDDTQLTQEERSQIEALLKVGHPQSEIATVLKRHKSTISHEVGRNHGLRGYRSKQAQRLALVRREARAKPTYVTTARSSPTIRPSPRDSTPKATSLTPTIPGSVDSTRTPTLIRQYLPKGTDFHSLTHTQVRSIMDRLNNRPRKCLDFKIPNQLFSGIKSPVALTS